MYQLDPSTYSRDIGLYKKNPRKTFLTLKLKKSMTLTSNSLTT